MTNFKAGDRVELIRHVGSHAEGTKGKVTDVDSTGTVYVVFDNCKACDSSMAFNSCDGYFNGYVDGQLKKISSEPSVVPEQNGCTCPSFDLTWIGHNSGCCFYRKAS